jgi:RNA 3'-terminal phosphate cyclase
MVTASSVASEITAFTAGKLEGQMFVVTVGTASTQDLTITPLEAGLIRAPAAFNLAIKGAATFMWTFDANGDGTADAGIWVRCG